MKKPIAKILPAAFLIAICFTLVSCMTEDDSDCPDGYRVTLHFSFTHHDHTPEPADLFAEWVEYIDLFIFDGEDTLIESFAVPRSSMPGGNTIALDLEPGSYKIVTWGNIENSGYTVNALEHSRGNYTLSVIENHPQVADLFFGSAEFTVEEADITRDVALIRDTHIVRVYIAGLPDATRAVPQTDFSVRIQGSNNIYDFENNTVADAAATYIPSYSTLTYGDEKFDLAEFKMQRLRIGDDTKMKVYREDDVFYEDDLTGRIVATYQEINTDDDLDRRYGFELFYELTIEGYFAFIGISDWQGPSMPGEL